MAEQEEIKRALVVAAHPDDSEFGCAGTAALWSRDNWEFYYLICSDGSKGTNDPEMSRERLAAMRQQEERAAAAVLGVKDVFFLNHQDGELAYDRELLKEIVRYDTSAFFVPSPYSPTSRCTSCATCTSTTPTTAPSAP